MIAMVLSACKGESAEVSQVVVVVDSNLAVDRELDRVQARVIDDGSGRTQSQAEFLLSDAVPLAERTPWPFSFGIAKGAARRVGLRVSGFGPESDEPLVEYATRVEFQTGKTLLVRAVLAAACRGRACGADRTCYPVADGVVAEGECGPILDAETRAIVPGREPVGVRPFGEWDAAVPGDSGTADAAARSSGEQDAARSGGEDKQDAGGREPEDGAGATAGVGSAMAPVDDADVDDDAGTPLTVESALTQELHGMIREQNRAIETQCACYQAFPGVNSERACKNEMGGTVVSGRTMCLTEALLHDPAMALPAVRCKRAAFRSYADCLDANFECPSPAGQMACEVNLNLKLQPCAAYPPTVKPYTDACAQQSYNFSAYAWGIQAGTSKVCRCMFALGYETPEDCYEQEGVSEGEYEALETCFFSVAGEPGPNPGEFVDVDYFYGCDLNAMEDYKRCVEPISACIPLNEPVDCRNAYRIARSTCMSRANFVVDPFTLCGQ